MIRTVINASNLYLGQKPPWTNVPWTKMSFNNCPLDKCGNTHSFRIVEHAHYYFHNEENSNCTFTIVENITI